MAHIVHQVVGQDGSRGCISIWARLAVTRRVTIFLAAAISTGSAAVAQSPAEPSLTMEAINGASIDTVATVPLDELAGDAAEAPDPAIIRLQVLLDRAGASPGVIDGYDGENVRKAVSAIEEMWDMPVDGPVDQLLERLATAHDVVVRYTIVEADIEDVIGPVPDDYSELAQLEFVGYASASEAIAEKFHMDQDLLEKLNPDAGFVVGEEIIVADPGPLLVELEVDRIEADKARRQVRAFASDGTLIAAYPATIGSETNPSPSGSHTVAAVVRDPNYTYDPDNFVQGDNTEKLIIPAGPNNPVGSTWIDLTEPGYGIHGTPEPAFIDKTGSHGCVRLTNWDAEELAGMVSQGVTVTFLDEQ
jgi:lipoprotein-anchoring transpeptidase ErfK/SrfK